MTLCRPLLCLLALLTLGLPASGQASDDTGPASRLHGAVRSQTRTTLVGSALPQARHAPDLGPLPADYPLHGITLVLRRSPAQQADLDQLLAAQQDPASAAFHHWLTPDEFADRFGAAESDLAAVEHWLLAQGFTLTGRSHARDRISFSGTAAQVAAAFGSPLHRLQIDGEAHIAPIADLTLPADLAAITTAILHLSDLRPHPQFHMAPQPAYTTSTGTHHLTPYDLQVLYDIPNNPSNNFAGAGQTLAIVGQSYSSFLIDESPLSEFQEAYTQPGGTVNALLVPGTGVEAIVPGDRAEADIDLEYASASVPGATLLYVYAGSDPHFSVFDALTFTIDQDLAPVISVSYGACETFLSTSDAAQADALFQQANAQGQTILASSGDTGSTACSPYPTSSSLSLAQQQALSVQFPASSPYVTAVGGTQMSPATFAAGSPAWSATPSTDGSPAATLLNYVPELAWNEGSATAGILAGGGGASALYPRPSWQSTFAGIPIGATRLVPDLALQASIASPGFLFCTDDASAVGSAEISAGRTNSCISTAGNLLVAGGTSFAAPTFAGIVTLLNQTLQQNGVGNINPVLYSLAASATPAFHDITTGSIACVAGSAGCSAAGESGFAAGAGYDEATGLGSLDVEQLFSAWPIPANSALAATQVSFSSDPSLIQDASPGSSITLSLGVSDAAVDPNSTPPTGTVTVVLDGVTLSTVPLTTPLITSIQVASTGDVTVPATTSNGIHIFHLTYSGDSTHAPASSTAAFTVGSSVATGAVTLTANNLSLVANGSGTTTVSIAPVGGYNGRLFWSLALTASSNGSSLPGCYFIPTVAIDGATTTTLSLGLGTACSAQPAARGRFHPLPALHATHSPAWQPSAATTIATGLLLFGLAPLTRRRRLASLLTLVLVLAALSAALTGCGGGNNAASTPTPPAAQAVTYTFSLTGQDSVNSNISSSTTFTVTVQ